MSLLTRGFTRGFPVPHDWAVDSIEIAAPRVKHALWEDAIALVTGAFLVSWGVVLLHEIQGVSGGLAGVALLVSYATGWQLGLVLFAINVPFLFLAWRRMG